MLNMVILMGRLTADPELRTTQGQGISVCIFTVAVERPKQKDKEQKTDFIKVRTWRQQADFVARFFRKGQMIAVVGELHRDPYTDKQGNTRFDEHIEATNVSFCGDKASDYGNAYNPQQNGYNMGVLPNGQMMPPAQNGSGYAMPPSHNGGIPNPQGQYTGQPTFSVLPDNNGDESGLPWEGAMPFNGDDDALPF